MITSLTIQEMAGYTSRQLNNFFPDKDTVDLKQYTQCVQLAHDRLEYCYKHVSLKHYFNGTEVVFNHLFSDQYVMYVWYLANTIWKETGNKALCNKLYYLNKSLHGLDCMFDTNLPDIFLIFHGVGTMLGKASYDDFFVVLHGCTIGSHNNVYPTMGKGVSLTANSSVIGNCNVGNRVSLSVKSAVFETDIPSDTTVLIDRETGKTVFKNARKNYAQQFFNVDLSSL